MVKHRGLLRAAYYIFAIVLGLALGMLSNRYGWKLSLTILFAAVILVLLGFGVNLAWSLRQNKRIQALAPLLEQDPRAYLEQLTALLEGSRSPLYQNVLHINRSVAYERLEDYSSAEQELLAAKPAKGANEAVYWGDLALYRFYLGREAEAIQIVEEHQEALSRYAAAAPLGKLLEELEILTAIAKDDPQAETLLVKAEQTWPQDAPARRDLPKLRARLEARKKQL